MKNVIVILPEDVALWLRVRAAKNGRSVSRWLSDLLESMKRREDEYEAAMERGLGKKALEDGVDRRPEADAGRTV